MPFDFCYQSTKFWQQKITFVHTLTANALVSVAFTFPYTHRENTCFFSPEAGTESCCGWTLIGARTATFSDTSGSDPLSTEQTSYVRKHRELLSLPKCYNSKGLH